MPCYDKKLEASRQDFFNDVYSTRDVDCVITTGELELMMREKGWDISTPVEGEELDRVPAENHDHHDDKVDLPELIDHPGTSSGSYLHTLITAIRHDSSEELELTVRAVRAPDYEEYILTEKATGSVVFRGAKCYGFRNLQNLVRKVGRDAGVQVGRGAAGRMTGLRTRVVRTKKANGEATEDKKYDYVEVMACPGGCVNGGGQLRPPVSQQNGTDAEGYQRDWESSGVKLDDEDVGRIQGQGGKWGNKDWTKTVELAYWHGLPTPPPSPTLNGTPSGPRVVYHKDQHVAQLATQVLLETCHPKECSVGSWTDTMNGEAEKLRRKYFRTQYRAVESEVIGLAVKW